MKKYIILLFTVFALHFANAQNWTTLNSSTSLNLYSVFFPDTDTGYVVGANGIILATTNGGSDWSLVPSPTSSNLTSVHFSDANMGYAAGENGVILNTSDGGVTWTELISGTSQSLYSIFFPATDTGYAVGADGIILKTTNGGGVWINRQNSSSQTIKIYPNPVIDKFTLELTRFPKNASISISNPNGQISLQQLITTNQIQIDLSSLPSSVYFLRYLDDQTVDIMKIIKE